MDFGRLGPELSGAMLVSLHTPYRTIQLSMKTNTQYTTGTSNRVQITSEKNAIMKR